MRRVSVMQALVAVVALLGLLGGTAAAARAGAAPSGRLATLARERAIQAVTGLDSTTQVIDKPVCPAASTGSYACAAQILYDSGTGRYVHPDLARPGVHTRAAATVPAAAWAALEPQGRSARVAGREPARGRAGG